MDLKGGQVVHAVAGQRDCYRPITSHITRSTAPRDVAQAIFDTFGIQEAYVADLDAIAGRRPDLDSLEAIAKGGLRMIVDAGVGTQQKARELIQFDRTGDTLTGIVVGLESLRDRDDLPILVKTIGARRLLLSLDLKAGKPFSSLPSLASCTPLEIAEIAWFAGFRRLIVLDLQTVGTAHGPSTLELCRSLRQQQRWLELVSGGGVR